MRRKEALLRRGGLPIDHPEPVARSPSYQEMEQKGLAADLLRLLAFLYPEAITEEIMITGAVELGPTLAPIIQRGGLLPCSTRVRHPVHDHMINALMRKASCSSIERINCSSGSISSSVMG